MCVKKHNRGATNNFFGFFLLTQKWRHQVIFINVLQDFTNVGLAVFFFTCKIAQSLFPQTHLTVPIAFTGIHDFPILLILHVVMHDLLVPAEIGCSVTFAFFAQCNASLDALNSEMNSVSNCGLLSHKALVWL